MFISALELYFWDEEYHSTYLYHSGYLAATRLLLVDLSLASCVRFDLMTMFQDGRKSWENIERIREGLNMKERGGITRTWLDREREAVVFIFSKASRIFFFGVD